MANKERLSDISRLKRAVIVATVGAVSLTASQERRQSEIAPTESPKTPPAPRFEMPIPDSEFVIPANAPEAGADVGVSSNLPVFADVSEKNSKDSRLVGETSPNESARQLSFLDFPLRSESENFAQIAQGSQGVTTGGRIQAWFDHTSPDLGIDQDLTRWDGQRFDFQERSPRAGESWYDGHNAIDIQARRPQEAVYAAASGKVVEVAADCRSSEPGCIGYGNFILIDHGNEYATLYAHLDRVAVRVGQEVSGDSLPIGTIGSIGTRAGAHLHFEVRHDENQDGRWQVEETVDPFGWQGRGEDPATPDSHYLWKAPLWQEATIDGRGAIVVSPTGRERMIVPEGTLEASINLKLWSAPVPPSSETRRSTGNSFWIEPVEPSHFSEFSQPITLTVTYGEMSHLQEARLRLYHWNEVERTWEPLPSQVNPEIRQVTATTNQLGKFDLQAPLENPRDISEPDDAFYSASPLTPDGSVAIRYLDSDDDRDWFGLKTYSENSYILTITPSGDQHLRVGIYASDGFTKIGEEQMVTEPADINLPSQGFGSYFIKVSSGSGEVNPNSPYSLSIRKQSN